MLVRSPLLTAIAGLTVLAAGMGIGRFLYTPLLPLISATNDFTVRDAGLVASANFGGYLLGALLAAIPRLSGNARLWMLGALVVSAITTGAMAIDAPLWIWAAFRFAGGISSAFVLVFASALVMAHLADTKRSELGSIHFAGVGTGILTSALIAAPWFFEEAEWPMIWIVGAAVTVVALLFAAIAIPPLEQDIADTKSTHVSARGIPRLVVAYGCLGFGYVVTATFIVTILRESAAGRENETLIWAIVGFSAIPSVAFWTYLSRRIGGLRAYQAALLIEACGVGVSVLDGRAAMLVAAVLLGGTFMGLTAMGFNEAVKRSSGDRRAVMALMTASFGTGQMIGPAIAGWLRETTGSFTTPSLVAAGVLIFGAVIIIPLVSSE
ncbi:MAG: YbfB/YjiJ family MFS transporter, partial [Pseudomonadota bacterium]